MISENPATTLVEKSGEEHQALVKESIPPPKIRKPLRVEVRIVKMIEMECSLFWILEMFLFYKIFSLSNCINNCPLHLMLFVKT